MNGEEKKEDIIIERAASLVFSLGRVALVSL